MGHFVESIAPGTVVLCAGRRPDDMPNTFGIIIPASHWQAKASQEALEKFEAENSPAGYVATAVCRRHLSHSYGWYSMYYPADKVAPIEPRVTVFDQRKSFNRFVAEVRRHEHNFLPGYCKYFLKTYRLMWQYQVGESTELNSPKLIAHMDAIAKSKG
jgi:hypothetical protein